MNNRETQVAKNIDVPNWKIQAMHRALTGLSQRRLEKRENSFRVVWLMNLLDNAVRAIEKEMNKVAEEFPAPEGWDGVDLPVAVAESRAKAINVILETNQGIPAFEKKRLLKEDDLPKLMKEADGDRNQRGLGAIIHDLYFLYPATGGETPELVDGKDGAEPVEE